MSKRIRFEAMKVGSPCGEKWAEMSGNDQVRFCSHCAKSVNDLSAITRKQARRLVRESEGNLCIRYIEHPITRRPVFADQLHQITRRAPGLAAGVMTASMTLATHAYAQSIPENVAPVSNIETSARLSTKPSEEQGAATGSVAGTIYDQTGAVIANAQIALQRTTGVRTTRTDEQGRYAFENLDPGNYRLEIDAEGFKSTGREVRILPDSSIAADEMLGIELNVTVEVSSGDTFTVIAGGIGMPEFTSPLARAVDNGEVEEVTELIAKGADVNAREEGNEITPLFVAIDGGNIDIVRILLDAGAKINARAADRSTPIMRLDDDATAELVQLLVRYGAKVGLANNDGQTALMMAAEYGSAEVLQALVDAGADVNVTDNEGETALMKAAERDEIEQVRVLLIAGARVNLRDNEGDNAWDYTTDDEIERLLESYGSETRVKQEAETASSDTEP